MNGAGAMKQRILVTGATGTVGSATLLALADRAPGLHVVAGVHRPGPLPAGAHESVTLDFTRPETLGPALAGVDRVLLVRPPNLADVKRWFEPFVEACARATRPHILFLSLQGAEANPITPHARIEALIDSAGLPRSFLRPAFFMQNLTAAHLAEIRDRSEIDIPAGSGRTAFIDARDIGEVAAIGLASPEAIGPEPELTGSEALTYHEVAAILSEELGRPIRYRRSSLTGFVARRVRDGDPLDYAAVMGAIYTVARLGKAGRLTDTLPHLLGRPPRGLREFVRDHAHLWQPAGG